MNSAAVLYIGAIRLDDGWCCYGLRSKNQARRAPSWWIRQERFCWELRQEQIQVFAFVYPLVNIQKTMEIAIEIVDLPINSMVDFSIVMSVRLPCRVTFFSNQRIFHTPRGQLDGSGSRCLRGFFTKAEHGFAKTLKYSGSFFDKNRLRIFQPTLGVLKCQVLKQWFHCTQNCCLSCFLPKHKNQSL